MLRLAHENAGTTGPIGRHRRYLLGRVHFAAKQLGLEDDDYRALLHRVTGERSARDCSNGDLSAVLAEFERLGVPSSAVLPERAQASHPLARKARALWISLYQLRAIEDPSERALESFARRQLGVDRLQWADQRHGYPLIEALKAMGKRHGWDPDVRGRMPASARLHILKDRLVGALLAKLAARGVAAGGQFARDRSAFTMGQLDRAIRTLAQHLRDGREAPE